MLLQELQKGLITAVVGNGRKVQQMSIFASREIRFTLLFPGEKGGDEAQESKPHFDQGEQDGLLLLSEPCNPIVGLNNS